jgi:hypothetical protein
VPIFIGLGTYAYGGSGCVAPDGNVVDSRAGCGSVRCSFFVFPLAYPISRFPTSFSVLQVHAPQELVVEVLTL